MTVDRCVAVLEPSSPAELVYVAMTRGRLGNRALVVCEGGDEHRRTAPATPVEVLAGCVGRPGGERSATEVLRGELERSEDLAVLVPLLVQARAHIDAHAGPDRRPELLALRQAVKTEPLRRAVARNAAGLLAAAERETARARERLEQAVAIANDVERRRYRLFRRPDSEERHHARTRLEGGWRKPSGTKLPTGSGATASHCRRRRQPKSSPEPKPTSIDATAGSSGTPPRWRRSRRSPSGLPSGGTSSAASPPSSGPPRRRTPQPPAGERARAAALAGGCRSSRIVSRALAAARWVTRRVRRPGRASRRASTGNRPAAPVRRSVAPAHGRGAARARARRRPRAVGGTDRDELQRLPPTGASEPHGAPERRAWAARRRRPRSGLGPPEYAAAPTEQQRAGEHPQPPRLEAQDGCQRQLNPDPLAAAES